MMQLQDVDILAHKDDLRLRVDGKGATQVFDPLRRGFVPATPEEMVRQLWILYFMDVVQISKKLMSVERAFQSHGMTRRFDLVIFDRGANPVLLAEFKGPEIAIKQSVFDQIARYNMQLQIPFSLVSNGVQHYCFRIDDDLKRFVWLERLPFDMD